MRGQLAAIESGDDDITGNSNNGAINVLHLPSAQQTIGSTVTFV